MFRSTPAAATGSAALTQNHSASPAAIRPTSTVSRHSTADAHRASFSRGEVLTRAIGKAAKVAPTPTPPRNQRQNKGNVPPPPPPEPVTDAGGSRRDALFVLIGAALGGAGATAYFKSANDADFRAAEAALSSMLDDPAFLESVAEAGANEVLISEFETNEQAVAEAISTEQQMDEELRQLSQQLEDVRKEVDEMTALAETRTAAARGSV